MLLFTWNLNRKEKAFRLAVDHLAQAGNDTLAVFQELPANASSTVTAHIQATNLTKGQVTCLGVSGSKRTPGRLGLFSASGISVMQPITSDSNHRMAMTVLKSASWSGLGVIGIHAVDRRNVAMEYARGAWAVLLRQQIEAFWKPNQPLVVMGDFNADPYHPEVSAKLGMFAVRDRAEAGRDWECSLLSGPMRPLYNPMWSLLAENPVRPGGTYLLNSEDQGIRWRLCDQILVSRELINKIHGEPEILSSLSSKTLTTKRGLPSSKTLSDHLPVQLRITM